MEPQAQAAMVAVRSIHGMAARRMPFIPDELWQRIYDMNLVAHLGLRVKDSMKAYWWVQGLFLAHTLWDKPWMDLPEWGNLEGQKLMLSLFHDIEIVHRQLFELLVQCQFTDGVQRQMLEVPMPITETRHWHLQHISEQYDAQQIEAHNGWSFNRF